MGTNLSSASINIRINSFRRSGAKPVLIPDIARAISSGCIANPPVLNLQTYCIYLGAKFDLNQIIQLPLVWPLSTQGILRKKMGFEGLIISDSLLMKAVYSRWGFVGSVLSALAAGNDMILALGAHAEKKEAISRARKLYQARGSRAFPGCDISVKKILDAKDVFIYPATDLIYREWGSAECKAHLKVHRDLVKKAVPRY